MVAKMKKRPHPWQKVYKTGLMKLKTYILEKNHSNNTSKIAKLGLLEVNSYN
jgi:hypothetical protein